jgi:hypothetical protein
MSEDAEAKSFWDQFFTVFGITRRRVATFEHKVPLPGHHTGYIDVLWKGVIMVEHKSRPRQRNQKQENGAIKEGRLPPDWENKPRF